MHSVDWLACGRLHCSCSTTCTGLLPKRLRSWQKVAVPRIHLICMTFLLRPPSTDYLRTSTSDLRKMLFKSVVAALACSPFLVKAQNETSPSVGDSMPANLTRWSWTSGADKMHGAFLCLSALPWLNFESVGVALVCLSCLLAFLLLTRRLLGQLARLRALDELAVVSILPICKLY